ncbi:MAG TPA: nickel pincer cofactor biosynthesis protein LarC [Verrucomicrobiae bacterium]|nr:nickel pincer cofactor biosynthesis protein LarC [Verrucomicrobiae bacterium]
MKTLYLDIFSGISGDMFIGALLDLGVDFQQLERELAKLGLDGYHLHQGRKQKGSIEGVKFDVHLEHEHHQEQAHDDARSQPHGDHHHAEEDDHDYHHAPAESGHQHEGESHSHSPGHGDHTHTHTHSHHHGEVEHSHPHEHAHGHEEDHHHEHSHEGHPCHEHEHEHGRNFAGIKALIHKSALSDWVKQRAIAVFHRVAVAEGKIHGLPPDEVHFHEVGAVDSIVDIVGACIGLELLGKPRVLAAPVVEGTGWVKCAHGRFPVPTAATLEILGARGVPLTQCEEPHELVTPTGAALLAEFAESFGPMRGLVASRIGYGLGTRDNRTRPNVVRAVLGTTTEEATTPGNDWETDTIAVLETNLDDINAEILGNFVERALEQGALDVFHTPVQMKKNRPAVLLTVLCPATEADRFTELMLRETSAFGVRRHLTERRKLRRQFTKAKTTFGEVTIKQGLLNGRVVQAAPEYESCKEAARATGAPLKDVYAAALAAVNNGKS